MSTILTDKYSIEEARALRDKAASQFCPKDLNHSDRLAYIGWLINNPNKCGSYLTKSWIKDDGTQLFSGVTPDQLGLLRALNGPHGYAVYKMLLLKKEVKQDGTGR